MHPCSPPCSRGSESPLLQQSACFFRSSHPLCIPETGDLPGCPRPVQGYWAGQGTHTHSGLGGAQQHGWPSQPQHLTEQRQQREGEDGGRPQQHQLPHPPLLRGQQQQQPHQPPSPPSLQQGQLQRALPPEHLTFLGVGRLPPPEPMSTAHSLPPRRTRQVWGFLPGPAGPSPWGEMHV